jgi:hypothetical protein
VGIAGDGRPAKSAAKPATFVAPEISQRMLVRGSKPAGAIG